MVRLFAKTLFAGALLVVAVRAHAFSLLGPYAIAGGNVWQVARIGYNEPPDVGGPMSAAAGEEYRWNTPNVFYAYDAAFLAFYRTRGAQEIEKAVKIINDLPPASLLNIDDYPLTGERINFRAAALGLLDLRSIALSLMLEEIGLASPSRWVFCLRQRGQPGPNRFPVFFNVIRRNYEPVILPGNVVIGKESPYINGHLWTYVDIVDSHNVPPGSFTINATVDPLDFGRFDPVAASGNGFSGFGIGSYFSGLTRDDVSAIKFIYQAANQNFDATLPGSTGAGTSISSGGGGGGGGGPWSIPQPNTNALTATNVTTTNATGLVDPTLRIGVDKLNLVRTEYDSILGLLFTPITNTYVETFIVTGGAVKSQKVQRVITVPDILFTAQDLEGNADISPIIPGVTAVAARSDTARWVNSYTLTGGTINNAGPGVIVPPTFISFSNVGFINPDEAIGPFGNPVLGVGALPYLLIGAFDGTTNEPVIFTQGGVVTVQDLERLALGR